MEELIDALRAEVTLVVVTHNLAQARRVSDRVAFLLDGQVIEESDVETIFGDARRTETRDYVRGTYG